MYIHRALQYLQCEEVAKPSLTIRTDGAFPKPIFEYTCLHFHYYSAKTVLCDRCCLSVCLLLRDSVNRVTNERVYGCRPNMVGMGKG